MTILIALAFGLNVHAAEYSERLTMTGMLDSSDQVVRGEVIGLEADWTDDGLITTFVTLAVDETLRLSNAPEVTFRVVGGTVGERTLTVPGAPVFEEGQDVLVFLDGDRLRGFGQGAFLIEDGMAQRALGNALDAQAVPMPIQRVIGDSEAARSCIREQVMVSYESGWSLRGSTIARLGNDDAQAYTLSLLEGLEYRLMACGDEQTGPINLVILDEDGRQVGGQAGQTRQADLVFHPPHTGTYTLAVVNESLPSDTWRASVAVSVSYR